MKTHFCHIMEGYDGNDAEYVGKSFCGLEYYEKGSNRFGDVDCKKCLKKPKRERVKIAQKKQKKAMKKKAKKQKEPHIGKVYSKTQGKNYKFNNFKL